MATRPGVVLVKLRSAASYDQARALLPASASIESSFGPASYALRVPIGAEERYVAQLAAMPQVAYAQLDRAVTAQVQPDDPRYAEQWNLPRIGMPVAWATITDTLALPIAVLDTGVKPDHPDLQGQLWTNPGEIAGNGDDDDDNGYVDDLHGWHFYHIYSGGQALPRQDADIGDDNGHGTHVAGIIAAAGNNGIGVTGVAWRARLMVVRVLDQDALGWESDIIQGLHYAIANGAKVVNISLGLPQPGPAFADAVDQAEARGVLVVAAAGNTGGTVLYPAAYPTVLSVGASDQSDRRAPFSSYGARLDLLAPGDTILSTWTGLPYFTRSGTSMAAPHVTGAAALLWSHTPAASPAQLRSCLIRAGTDLGAPGRDDDTGWGRLDVARALGCPHLTFLPLV